jgi:hypothetical protein
MIEYIKITSKSSMPKLASDGAASVKVLKMICSFLANLITLSRRPILIERRIVA